MPPIVQHRRGTLASLTAANETPSAGEIYFESDTNKLKIGDGVTPYNSLPYVVGGSSSGASGGSASNQKLDALTFNGSATTFTLSIGTEAVSPATASSILILINGVVQEPGVAYTVSGSQITFSVAPSATDTFFGVYLVGSSATFSSPGQITGNQNNYQLAVGANHTRISSDAARTITGFVAQAGASVTLHNVGSFSISIANESASSAAANRVITPTGADIAIPARSSVTLTYDATTARWRATAVVQSTIDAWWASSSDKTKLDGIASNATENATDAQLRDRATHTGQQAISTVSGLSDALDGKQAAGTYANATHTHTISAVDGLQSALDGKQASGSYAGLAHGHAIVDVAGLQSALDARAAVSHTHTIGAVAGLQAALDSKQAFGVYATLVDGKVPASQLPSFVDDVIEVDTTALLPSSGEEGKIYVAINSGKVYRWTGSAYIEIVASPGSTDVVAEGSNNLYFTTARAVSAVQSSLDSKAAAVHTHGITDVVGLQTALTGKVDASDSRLSDARFPTAHAASHGASGGDPITVSAGQVTGLANVATSGSASDLGTGTLPAARLPTTGVTAGSYGSASSVATYTVGADGRLTAAGSTAIAISAGAVSGLGSLATKSSVAWSTDITGIPSTFTPAAHNQAWSTITSTPTTLSGYGITDGVTTSDSRLSNSRSPTAHKSTHATGGTDAITASDIGAAASSHTHIHSDVGNSPATLSQFSASQNNLSLGTGGIVRISSNAAVNITGFAATSAGDARLLSNVGSFSITLKHADTGSTAANRILCAGNADVEIPAGGSAVVYYDGTDSRWRCG